MSEFEQDTTADQIEEQRQQQQESEEQEEVVVEENNDDASNTENVDENDNNGNDEDNNAPPAEEQQEQQQQEEQQQQPEQEEQEQDAEAEFQEKIIKIQAIGRRKLAQNRIAQQRQQRDQDDEATRAFRNAPIEMPLDDLEVAEKSAEQDLKENAENLRHPTHPFKLADPKQFQVSNEDQVNGGMQRVYRRMLQSKNWW